MIIIRKQTFLLAFCFLGVVLGSTPLQTPQTPEQIQKEAFSFLQKEDIPLLNRYSYFVTEGLQNINRKYREKVKEIPDRKQAAAFLETLCQQENLLTDRSELREKQEEEDLRRAVTGFVSNKLTQRQDFKGFQLTQEDEEEFKWWFFVDILLGPFAKYENIQQMLQKMTKIFRVSTDAESLDDSLRVAIPEEYFMLVAIYAAFLENDRNAHNFHFARSFRHWNYLTVSSFGTEAENTFLRKIEAIYRSIYLLSSKFFSENASDSGYGLPGSFDSMKALQKQIFANNALCTGMVQDAIQVLLHTFLIRNDLTSSLAEPKQSIERFILSMHPLESIARKYEKTEEGCFPLEISTNTIDDDKETHDFGSISEKTQQRCDTFFRAESVSISIGTIEEKMMPYLCFVIDMYLFLVSKKNNQLELLLNPHKSTNDLLQKLAEKYEHVEGLQITTHLYERETPEKDYVNWITVSLEKQDPLAILASQINPFSQSPHGERASSSEKTSPKGAISGANVSPLLGLRGYISQIMDFVLTPVILLQILISVAAFVVMGIFKFAAPLLLPGLLLLFTLTLLAVMYGESQRMKKHVFKMTVASLVFLFILVTIYTAAVLLKTNLIIGPNMGYIAFFCFMSLTQIFAILLSLLICESSKSKLQSKLKLASILSYILYGLSILGSLLVIAASVDAALIGNGQFLYKILYSHALLFSAIMLLCGVAIDIRAKTTRGEAKAESLLKSSIRVGGIVLLLGAIGCLIYTLQSQHILKHLFGSNLDELKELLYPREEIIAKTVIEDKPRDTWVMSFLKGLRSFNASG